MLVTIAGIAALLFGPPCWRNRKAKAITEAMSHWDAATCAEIWQKAQALAASTKSKRIISRDELPQALHKAGFQEAEIYPGKFVAYYGTTAWGPIPPMVVCWLNGEENPEPELRYTGGRFFPDGRFERSPIPKE